MPAEPDFPLPRRPFSFDSFRYPLTGNFNKNNEKRYLVVLDPPIKSAEISRGLPGISSHINAHIVNAHPPIFGDSLLKTPGGSLNTTPPLLPLKLSGLSFES